MATSEPVMLPSIKGMGAQLGEREQSKVKGWEQLTFSQDIWPNDFWPNDIVSLKCMLLHTIGHSKEINDSKLNLRSYLHQS